MNNINKYLINYIFYNKKEKFKINKINFEVNLKIINLN